MTVPRDILSDLRTYVEVEIQAGRRHAQVDAEAVKDFLSAKPGDARPKTGAKPAASAPAPAVAAVSHAPAPKPAPPAAVAEAPGFVPTQEPAFGVEARAAAAADLAALAAAVTSCSECPLARTRHKAVPGEGNANGPDVMFVGEAPGRDEDEKGRPFVGRAGQLLDKMILAMGYQREEVFIANILKCRPPNNRTPTPDEMALCIPYLKKQIALVKPKTIVALGATAFRGLLNDPQASITRVRGVWTTFEGIPLMPTFHPAYLLRAPAAKRVVWEDLQKVMAKLGKTKK